jgi:hypothetical protein
MQIGFNSRFLTEMLNNLNSDEGFHWKRPSQPRQDPTGSGRTDEGKT